MKLVYIILFGGHFSAFLTLCVEKFIVEYKARKVLILKFARKISIISSSVMTPSFLITDTQPGEKNFVSEIDLRNKKNAHGPPPQEQGLQPPQDPDAIIPFDDEE